MQNKGLEGRTAVVTGARRGIGKAIAMRLGEAGARLALVDHESAEEAAAEARAKGYDAQAYLCDVRDPSSVERLAADTAARFPAVHVVVNAAGIPMRRRVSEISLEEWRDTIDVNLTGPFLVARAFLPRMRGQGYGRIVNMTSVMAHIASADRPAYCAAKAGLLALTRSLALDLAAERITVNAISPGAIATDMTAALRADDAANARLMAITPLQRWGEPGEIGALAAFLCSEDAAYITGTDVVIDGGWLAQ
jgi:NAD(P)-dependent dehydrogenase (short-subunit alcohol dehydrogenase family)